MNWWLLSSRQYHATYMNQCEQNELTPRATQFIRCIHHSLQRMGKHRVWRKFKIETSEFLGPFSASAESDSDLRAAYLAVDHTVASAPPQHILLGTSQSFLSRFLPKSHLRQYSALWEETNRWVRTRSTQKKGRPEQPPCSVKSVETWQSSAQKNSLGTRMVRRNKAPQETSRRFSCPHQVERKCREWPQCGHVMGTRTSRLAPSVVLPRIVDTRTRPNRTPERQLPGTRYRLNLPTSSEQQRNHSYVRKTRCREGKKLGNDRSHHENWGVLTGPYSKNKK